MEPRLVCDPMVERCPADVIELPPSARNLMDVAEVVVAQRLDSHSIADGFEGWKVLVAMRTCHQGFADFGRA